jgi:hypothetical protein
MPKHLPRCLAALAISGAAACKSPPPAETPVVVPMATGELTIDGEWEESDWSDVAVRRVFAADGEEARPYSEIRCLHDAQNLYVGLYAGDQNVGVTDYFDLTIGALHFHADPRGTLTPAIPGARSAADLDGTFDDGRDEDEEWLVELALPLSAIGIRHGLAVPIKVSRCDLPKDGATRCGGWAAALALAPAATPMTTTTTP